MDTAFLGKKAMVEWLIKNANFKDFSDVDDIGNTPLHYAVWNAHLDITKFLLGARVPIDARNNNGDDALKIAYKQLQKISQDNPKDENKISNLNSIINLLKNKKTENQEQVSNELKEEPARVENIIVDKSISTGVSSKSRE